MVHFLVSELNLVTRKEVNGEVCVVERVRVARLMLEDHSAVSRVRLNRHENPYAYRIRTGTRISRTSTDGQFRYGQCYQPMTMLDSMTFRARSRSVPVSCMYRRIACTL